MDDAINDPGDIENIATNEELENVEEMPPAKDEGQPPTKKKRTRKSKAKKHQVGAKVKNRNQRNYRYSTYHGVIALWLQNISNFAGDANEILSPSWVPISRIWR